MNVTRAWVWIVGESSQYKEMKIEDLKSLCKSRDLVICNNGKMFDADEYAFEPDVNYIRRYSFVVGSYETQPSVVLVPRGTTIEFGRYVFPTDKDIK